MDIKYSAEIQQGRRKGEANSKEKELKAMVPKEKKERDRMSEFEKVISQKYPKLNMLFRQDQLLMIIKLSEHINTFKHIAVLSKIMKWMFKTQEGNLIIE